jgi:rhodanese-related sulfurtransferase
MSFQNIGPEKFKQLMEKEDHLVLDVRSPQELAEGSIPGHQMINVFEPTFRDKIDQLDRDKTYLVYCRSGNRSSMACGLMAQLGFKALYNLEGGIGAWNATMAMS